ncbi:MAG: hypothetical protein JNL45_09310 [Hyphomicrobium sp.]|jgi:hypothetical protein|nr:hypothetical protein [Hyphomicrobium sp.]
MSAIIKQRHEDETDAERRDRLAVNGSKRRKSRALKGNLNDPGGVSIADRAVYRLGDAVEEWARAIVIVARELGLKIEFIHACDLLGWAIERRPLLLTTLYSARPSPIIAANILENSEPLARYAPTLSDIEEFYEHDAEVAKKIVQTLGADETRRRWFTNTLPKASSVLPRTEDAPALFCYPATSGASRA